MKSILVTGGAGFIGSHLVRLLVNKYPEYHIVNMDVLTYAGNLDNLKDIQGKENYTFVKCDICDIENVKQVFVNYKINSVIHLAAESHVDRSIEDPFTFAQTNVMGTLSLLQVAKGYWNGDFTNKFLVTFLGKCLRGLLHSFAQLRVPCGLPFGPFREPWAALGCLPGFS